MLHEKTIEYIAGLSDEALAAYILVGTRAYEPEALAFAQKELDGRKIAPQRLTEIRRPMLAQLAQYDARGSVDRTHLSESSILCQGCGYEAPNKYAEYQQNIGAFVIRFSSHYKGCFCKNCHRKFFWKASLITFACGWWGLISLFVAPAFLLGNLFTYLGTWSLPPFPENARKPILDSKTVAALQPHGESIIQRLEDGENMEDVARSLADQTGLTPGQVLCGIRARIQGSTGQSGPATPTRNSL